MHPPAAATAQDAGAFHDRADKPVADNADEDGRARNRRVEPVKR
ncbi:hypothetical protein [Stenotrophomonas nitritireducens]|nr:hypothetical protein [Stenotrophomonas nitritireducens]